MKVVQTSSVWFDGQISFPQPGIIFTKYENSSIAFLQKLDGVALIVANPNNWTLDIVTKKKPLTLDILPVGPLIKGNRTIADLRYGEEDIIRPNTLILASKKS